MLAQQVRQRHRVAAGLGRADQLLGVGRPLDVLDPRLERERSLERAAAERDPAAAVGHRSLPAGLGAANDADTHMPLLKSGLIL